MQEAPHSLIFQVARKVGGGAAGDVIERKEKERRKFKYRVVLIMFIVIR